MKISRDNALILFAILLNIIQIAFFAFFLATNTTDNLPLIIFLIVAPLVNLTVLAQNI